MRNKYRLDPSTLELAHECMYAHAFMYMRMSRDLDKYGYVIDAHSSASIKGLKSLDARIRVELSLRDGVMPVGYDTKQLFNPFNGFYGVIEKGQPKWVRTIGYPTHRMPGDFVGIDLAKLKHLPTIGHRDWKVNREAQTIRYVSDRAYKDVKIRFKPQPMPDDETISTVLVNVNRPSSRCEVATLVMSQGVAYLYPICQSIIIDDDGDDSEMGSSWNSLPIYVVPSTTKPIVQAK